MSKAVVEGTHVRRATNYLACLLLVCNGAPAPAGTSVFKVEDLKVPSDAGIELHLRNMTPGPQRTFAPERIVLLVHGATFPASSTFGVELPGLSWMTNLASRGYDVYALDIRGYGGSTRPAAMSQPPEANSPFAAGAEAVRDIGAAVDFILQRRGVSKLSLVGWSWGTTTTAAYAAENPGKVGRLVLLSPVWVGARTPPHQGAYRTSTHDSARAFAIRGIPPDRVEEIAPIQNFDTWWRLTLATDPEGAAQSPPVVRSPNGALEDLEKSWGAGKPTYDPSKIRAPTLLVVGEWDVITPPSMAQDLYSALVNARPRKLVRMPEATHFMIIEEHRVRLMRKVENFLDTAR